MSKVINLLAIGGAAAITGYFIYKVILPQLKDFQWPTWQFPDFSQMQQPQQPSQDGTAPQQQQQPPQQLDEEGGGDEEGSAQKTETSSPSTPADPSPAAAGLIYDSNLHGKWNSGRRVVTQGDGNTNPGGMGLHTAASGNPTLTIDGNGVAHLESSRWGRVYIYAKNYNSRLEGNFMFETDHGDKDNISIKMRSRHGNNNHPQGGGNQFGGIGYAFHPSGEIELAAEITHGGSSYSFGSLKGPPLTLGKWHKFAISTYDGGGGINVKVDVDGQNVGSKKWPNPASSAIDKAAFNADSYFWIRLNCHDGKRAKAAFSNLRLYNLGESPPVSTQFLRFSNPYLYNSFYNRRRL